MKPLLPIVTLIIETYAQVWAMKGRLALAVAPGLLVSLAVVVIGSEIIAGTLTAPDWVRPLFSISFVAAAAVSVMAAHRAVLLPSQAVHWRLWKGELLTVLYAAVMLFIAGFFIITALMPMTAALDDQPSMGSMVSFYGVTSILSVVVVAGVCRMLLTFPATALDQGPFAFRLAESWYSVKHNAWRLFIVLFFVLLAPMVLTYMAPGMVAKVHGEMYGLVASTIGGYLVITVLSVCLSLIYRFVEVSKED